MSNLATREANRPTVSPAASTRYHLRPASRFLPLGTYVRMVIFPLKEMN
jgi:hypothetical protein